MSAPTEEQSSNRSAVRLVAGLAVGVLIVGGLLAWHLRAPTPYVVVLPPGSMSSGEASEISPPGAVPDFSSLDPADPATAKAEYDRLIKIPNERRRIDSLHAFGVALAVRDPRAALALLETLPHSSAVEEATLGAIQTWVREAPTATLDYLKALPDGDFSDFLLGEAIGLWSNASPPQAIEWAGGLPVGDRRDLALESIAEAWANAEPRAAAAWAEALPAGPSRDRAMSALVGAWAESDALGALEFTGKIADPERRNGAVSDALAVWADAAPVDAAAWARQHLNPREDDMAINSLLSAWTRKDGAAALAWLRELPDEEMREAATTQLFATWAGVDPAHAADAISGLNDSKLRDQATLGLIGAWSEEDPAAAANWLARQSPAIQSAGIDQVIEPLARADLAQAGLWVKSLPPGQLRDRGLEGYSRVVFDENPAQALTLALDIQHPITRDQQLSRLLGQWWKFSPDAARQWAAQAPLAPTLRSKLDRVFSTPAAEPGEP